MLLAGFGNGMAETLLKGLVEQGARDMTLVANSGGRDQGAIADLLASGQVSKTHLQLRSRRQQRRTAVHRWETGDRDCAAGHAGGTATRCRRRHPGLLYADRRRHLLAEGRETRVINGRNCLLEYPLQGDVALVDAWQADRWGNLTHRESARNFNPVMATAAKLTIVQARHKSSSWAISRRRMSTPPASSCTGSCMCRPSLRSRRRNRPSQ